MNKIAPPSPWSFADEWKSPVGNRSIRYQSCQEFHMNSPLGGYIEISPGEISYYRDQHFNRFFGGPPVWSPDGRYAAVPEWEILWHHQRLCVFDFEQELQGVTPAVYGVLHLQSIDAGEVLAVNSPVHEPENLHLRLDSLSWVGIKEYPDMVMSDGRRLTFEAMANYLAKKFK